MRLIDILSEFVSDMRGLGKILEEMNTDEQRQITHYLPHAVYFECGCYFNRKSREFSECKLHKLMFIMDMGGKNMETIGAFNKRVGMSKEYIEENKGNG